MRLLICTSIAIAAFASSTVQAEVPLLGPAELQKAAAHIVTGEVQHIYTKDRALRKDYIDTLFAVEVIVTGVEKGKTIETRQVIFAKAWRAKKRLQDWAGPSGQDSIPKNGALVKLYLTGDNGSYEALSPNGIQIVKRGKAK